MNTLPAVLFIEGEVLGEVIVSAEQMARFNEARETFRELKAILLMQVIPSLDPGLRTTLATEIECRLENIEFASGHFLWKSRHAGASHDAVHVGGGR